MDESEKLSDKCSQAQPTGRENQPGAAYLDILMTFKFLASILYPDPEEFDKAERLSVRVLAGSACREGKPALD